MNPSVILLAIPVGVGALILWGHEDSLGIFWRRVLTGLFAALAFLLVIGISVWQDALASLLDSPLSFGVLLGVDVGAGFLLYLHTWKTHGEGKSKSLRHYHAVYTHIVALIGGTAAALTVANGINLLLSIQHAPAGTGSALSTTIHQVSSGHAGHAVSHTTGVVSVLIALAVILVLASRGHHHKGTGKKNRPQAPGGSPVKAITSGKGM